jgi:hypothetical protein
VKPGVPESAYKAPGLRPSILGWGRKPAPRTAAQARAYQLHQQAKKQAAAQTERMVSAQYGGVEQIAARANKVVSPAAGAIIKALSPYTAAKEAAVAARHGKVGPAVLAATGILPVGPGKAREVAQAVKAGREAVAAEAATEAVKAARVAAPLRVAPARSRITRALIERPADVISRAVPNAPLVGAKARAFKTAGRIERVEQPRQRIALYEHVHVLPKKGTNADIAHFWWAQLPASERNVGGLVRVRDAFRRELDALTGGVKYQGRRLTAKGAVGRNVEARQLAATISRLDRVIASNPKLDQGTINAVHALSADRTRILTEHGLLSGESAQNRPGIVSRYLGLEPTGEEAYLGHRPGKIRGSGGVRSIGLGKPMKPQGLQQNTLALLRSGGLRQSTHVAAEDWNAAQTYQDAKRIRQTLFQMGEPFQGSLPEGHVLVNPHGKVIPSAWKHDVFAEFGKEHEGLRAQVDQMLGEFVADRSNWRAMVEKAKEGGYLNDLRILRDQDVKKFYSQFLQPGARTAAGRGFDTGLDVLANSLIFARLGYVPKNFAQNIIMAVPHQGLAFLANVPRAVQLIPHPGSSALDRKLWKALVQESGAGVSGIVAQETYRKALGAIPKVVTAAADEPLRVSAFIHEAAAEGVIPRLSVHLSDADKQSLLDLLTNPARREQLNTIMQRSRDAMGDFERLTPAQRRMFRRFLIVPGWLTAGTRYPLHFAATHPIRSAALAYAAAGEPGAPKRYQVNRPIDEYLARGLPSYIRALPAGKGKIERVQSVLPGSIPFDVGIAALQGEPLPNVAGYANPLAPFLYNTIAGMRETATGETQRVGFLNALKENWRGLAPSALEAANIARPGTFPSRVYPDKSRLGQLARAAGVVPVKYSAQAALEAQYRERGMQRTLSALKDREAFFKELAAAGYRNPSPELVRAYELKELRAKRLDKIKASGLEFQKKAYRAEVELAISEGLIPADQAARARASYKYLNTASQSSIQRSRRWLADHVFEQATISSAKRQLHAATG